MSSRAADLLSALFPNGQQPAVSAVSPSAIPMKVRNPDVSSDEFAPTASKKRTAIWDMHHSVTTALVHDDAAILVAADQSEYHEPCVQQADITLADLNPRGRISGDSAVVG